MCAWGPPASVLCSRRRACASAKGRHRFPARAAFAGDHEAVVVALVANETLIAQRFRTADAAAVQNQRVGGSRPPFRRHRLAQLLFDDDRIVRFGDADAIRDAEDMPIHRQSRNAERVPEHHVRGLAPDTRQRDQRLHRRRHLAVVRFDERLRHADDRSSLRAKEAGRVNQRLDVRMLRVRQRAGVGIACEERRRRQIHAGVS